MLVKDCNAKSKSMPPSTASREEMRRHGRSARSHSSLEGMLSVNSTVESGLETDDSDKSSSSDEKMTMAMTMTSGTKTSTAFTMTARTNNADENASCSSLSLSEIECCEKQESMSCSSSLSELDFEREERRRLCRSLRRMKRRLLLSTVSQHPEHNARASSSIETLHGNSDGKGEMNIQSSFSSISLDDSSCDMQSNKCSSLPKAPRGATMPYSVVNL